jgi:ferredoxin
MCALTAPALFDQDDEDGRVLLLDSAPGLHQQEAARNAAHACPCAVITILE